MCFSPVGGAGLPQAGGQRGGPDLRPVQGAVWDGGRGQEGELQPGPDEDPADGRTCFFWETLCLQGPNQGENKQSYVTYNEKNLFCVYLFVDKLCCWVCFFSFFCSMLLWGSCATRCSGERCSLILRSTGLFSAGFTCTWWMRCTRLSTRWRTGEQKHHTSVDHDKPSACIAALSSSLDFFRRRRRPGGRNRTEYCSTQTFRQRGKIFWGLSAGCLLPPRGKC